MLYQYYQQRIFPHLLNQVMQTPSLMQSRQQLLSPIHGEILEIGFGTGINLPFYQAAEHVYALEPNIDIFHLAHTRILNCLFPVQHIQASAEKLPFADQSIQHVVSTWTLCSIAHLDQALAEIYRVLSPQGQLHLVEHVQYHQHPLLKNLQHVLTPVQKIVADGCHLDRNIELSLLNAGFQLDEKHYFDAVGIPKIARRMLLARASKTQEQTD